MSKDLFVPRTALLLACLGMVFPQVAIAGAPGAPWQAHKTIDVILFQGGQLWGQVVNPQGHPKAGAMVFIRQHDRDVTQVRTDDLGRFSVKGLSGGAYELVTADTSRQIRAWTQAASPPAAAQVALLIVAGTTVRGQIDALPDTYPSETINGTYTNYAGDEAIYGDAIPSTYEPLYPELDEAAFVETKDVTNSSYGNAGYNQPVRTHVPHRHTGPRFLGVRPWVWGSVAAVIAIPIALDNNDAS